MHPDLKPWSLNCRKCCLPTTATTFKFDDRCALKVFPETVCFKNLTYSHQNQAKLPITMPQFPLCKNEKKMGKNFQAQR